MLDACTSSVASIRRPTLRPSRTSPRMLPSGWLPSSRRPTSRRRPTGQSRHASSTLSPTTSPQRSRARPDVCAVQGDNPAAGLTTTARALACDLIVIGATARGRVADALRGGLRDALVEQADCPVTVVPPVRGAADRRLRGRGHETFGASRKRCGRRRALGVRAKRVGDLTGSLHHRHPGRLVGCLVNEGGDQVASGGDVGC
jgi:hypothetical protein